MVERFFNLGEGENIVKDIRPVGNLKWYFFFAEGLGLLVIFGLLLIGLALPLMIAMFGTFSRIGPTIFILFLPIAALLFAYVYADFRYKKQHYWITNKRIVYKRGFLGYRVTSIPYERISDIIISRSFVERLFGFGSLHVQTLAGQMTGSGRLGAEGRLLGVPDPEGTQELIFKLSKEKRKAENITF
jgi:uncharacterized membrane protein YdbT with pleckstrin-like domain